MSTKKGIAELLFGGAPLRVEDCKRKLKDEDTESIPVPTLKVQQIPKIVNKSKNKAISKTPKVSKTKPIQSIRPSMPEMTQPRGTSKSSVNPTEKRLLNKIKNFDNINDLFETIEKNNKEFNQLFPDEIKHDKINRETTGRYKACTKNEDKFYQKIDEINKSKVKEEIKLLGKKQKSESKVSNGKRKEVYLEDDAIFCARCRSMHRPNEHKVTTPFKEPDYDKIFSLDNSRVKKEEKIPKPNIVDKISKLKMNVKKVEVKSGQLIQRNDTQQLPRTNHSIRANENHKSNGHHVPSLEKKINLIKTKVKTSNPQGKDVKTKVKGIFSPEDFYEDDGFIVSDEDEANNENFRKEMSKLRGKFRRNNHNYDYGDDDDLEEANFDTIQREEYRTARIGDYEDYEEEQREIRMKKKLK